MGVASDKSGLANVVRGFVAICGSVMVIEPTDPEKLSVRLKNPIIGAA